MTYKRDGNLLICTYHIYNIVKRFALLLAYFRVDRLGTGTLYFTSSVKDVEMLNSQKIKFRFGCKLK